MFTTDEDQKQHLEKEAHGQLLDEETTEEKQEIVYIFLRKRSMIFD
jgi:hypothetical protein